MSLSTGLPLSKSFITSLIAFNWSSVSTYGKVLQNLSYSTLSIFIGRDFDWSLLEAILINFFEASLIFFLASAFLFCQLEAPSLSRFIVFSSSLPYFVI